MEYKVAMTRERKDGENVPLDLRIGDDSAGDGGSNCRVTHGVARPAASLGGRDDLDATQPSSLRTEGASRLSKNLPPGLI